MIPLVLPVILEVKELILPVTDKLVPVAAPRTGLVKVGLVESTTEPEPVLVVTPVPPLATGNAVPESVSARVPFEVIGEPETDKKEGTVSATEVTVPVLGVVQVIAVLTPPCEVSTCPVVPTVIGKLKL
jgi:hypothetical protein